MKRVSKKLARRATEQEAMAADAALVAAGRSARRRQRKRAVKRALKVAGKAVFVAGAAAATIMAVRAGTRKTP